MKIVFVASEVFPFAKTGGLADVSGALPKYVSRNGIDVRVFMPFYSTIDTSKGSFYPVEFLRDIPVKLGGETVTFSVITTRLPESDVEVFLIDCPRFFHRGSIYTDQEDEYLRFALLSHAAIVCCQHQGWSPDIFHCNDWQSALIPLLLKTVYKWDGLFHRTRTVLTIHNIAYQGVFNARVVERIGLGDYRDLLHQDDLRAGNVNYLKTGITYADIISTVSRTYAREIQTSEYGAGLEGLLQRRSDSLFGIVNGVDYNEWSPEQDKLIPYNYSANDLTGKELNKQALMQRLELPFDPAVPVLGIVSRLTAQKGFDLFLEILPPMLHHYNIRLAVLGSGEAKYERFFSRLESIFPHRTVFYRGFSNELSHLIEAGSDIFLMPSSYEPCGLNQIYSLRYGTIPVVRKTGGLADTVQNFNHATGEGTGFVFEDFTSQGLSWAMETAIKTYVLDKGAWGLLMQHAMAQNFSWDVQVREYLEMYGRLVGWG